ncbi:MAG: S-methyl-5-thioribose-1-phosphate isomerase [Coriobacteriales bacterium]|jgi:methylthioribose-1-phosphate isomerase|nr:S-methyl-5-thioribose-1-phosphate isomerase [Coriobacteriales bacterium]
MPADLANLPRTIWWDVDAKDKVPGVYLIDQTRLPLTGDILCCRTLEGLEIAVKTLAVRGAPALGVAAAMGVALWSENEFSGTTVEEWLSGVDAAAARIGTARPTAVNLAWGAEQARQCARAAAAAAAAAPGDAPGAGLQAARQALVAFARQMAADDEATCRAIGAAGRAILPKDARILTHCNAGSLGTAYFGTVGGVIYTGFDAGLVSHVWVDETRPLNQGGRLTAWEMLCAGIPSTLIADNMAASVMARGLVDLVLVGADRICVNGDTANKIGTLGVAILARHYHIPFYVCAPFSTIDPELPEGSGIPIEQRDPRELEGCIVSGTILPDDAASSQAFDLLTAQGLRHLQLKGGHQMSLERKGAAYAFDAWFKMTPAHVQVYNPAFDVTPAGLITGIVTERGVFAPGELAAALGDAPGGAPAVPGGAPGDAPAVPTPPAAADASAAPTPPGDADEATPRA